MQTRRGGIYWKRGRTNWIGHTLRCNCLIKHGTERKIERTGRRGKRSKQLMIDLKETIRYWKLKDRTPWRTRWPNLDFITQQCRLRCKTDLVNRTAHLLFTTYTCHLGFNYFPLTYQRFHKVPHICSEHAGSTGLSLWRHGFGRVTLQIFGAQSDSRGQPSITTKVWFRQLSLHRCSLSIPHSGNEQRAHWKYDLSWPQ